VAELHDVEPPRSGPKPPTDDDRPFPIRLVLLGLLGLYLLLFIILNSGSVTVNFVFFKSEISLIVGLVLAIVLGFASGYIVNELRIRRRRKGAQL
jgi:uncharacterized integral membrane protein